jgi:ADP-dependent NAD(P)H-hydrate dehydratase
MLRSVSSLPRLPVRPKDGYKGTFGKVLIVAGSVGMSGAAILAGQAALRSGAGLVHIACPHPIQNIVAAGNPCYLTTPLPSNADGSLAASAADMLLPLLVTAKSVAFGPGLGKTSEISDLLAQVLNEFPGQIIIDADGLASYKTLHNQHRITERKLPVIVTPHPGEMSQLMDLPTQVIQSDRKMLSVKLATEHKLVVVLKGHGTIVTDGQRVYTNTTGNTGLAKGGSGDVLTGIIAALAAQNMPALEAAQVGVYIHGLAGDLAAASLSEMGMLPTDIIEALPMAFRKYVPTV